MSRGNISKLFCAHWNERTPGEAARRALEKLIPSLSKAAIPVNVEAAARCAGIDHILDTKMSDCDGLLSATSSGTYVVSINREQSDSRKRFTLAHEIGHAVVYQSIGRRSSLHKNGRLVCQPETADERDEERLCDLIAAELLMPRDQFVQAIDETGVCAETVSEVARKFGVSLRATSKRFIQLVPYEVSFCLWSASRDGACFIPKWYLTKKGVMSPGYAIEFGRPGSECFSDEPVRGWHWISLHGHMDRYFVDVFPLHTSPRAWLMLIVFSNAAEHIMARISRRTEQASGQLPLMDL